MEKSRLFLVSNPVSMWRQTALNFPDREAPTEVMNRLVRNCSPLSRDCCFDRNGGMARGRGLGSDAARY